MTTVLSESTPKARRAHVCSWCREKIVVGERHYRQSLVDHGEFWDARMHNECHEAMHRCKENLDDPSIVYTRGCTCEQGDHGDWCAKEAGRG
jgi:hypothetical protein